jgi:hypothetical protein
MERSRFASNNSSQQIDINQLASQLDPRARFKSQNIQNQRQRIQQAQQIVSEQQALEQQYAIKQKEYEAQRAEAEEVLAKVRAIQKGKPFPFGTENKYSTEFKNRVYDIVDGKATIAQYYPAISQQEINALNAYHQQVLSRSNFDKYGSLDRGQSIKIEQKQKDTGLVTYEEVISRDFNAPEKVTKTVTNYKYEQQPVIEQVEKPIQLQAPSTDIVTPKGFIQTVGEVWENLNMKASEFLKSKGITSEIVNEFLFAKKFTELNKAQINKAYENKNITYEDIYPYRYIGENIQTGISSKIVEEPLTVGVEIGTFIV